MYVSGVKILSYLAAGSKNGYCSGFAFKPQAKKQLRDLGHVSRFFPFIVYVQWVTKQGKDFISELFF